MKTKFIPSTSSCLMISIATVLCTNCANTSHLLVYQHTNFGMNAGLNPQTGNIHARIGLRKDFACVIPKITDETTKEIKAASSYVSSRVRVRSPFEAPDIAEIIATGQAAVQMGDKEDALTPFVTPTKKK